MADLKMASLEEDNKRVALGCRVIHGEGNSGRINIYQRDIHPSPPTSLMVLSRGISDI